MMTNEIVSCVNRVVKDYVSFTMRKKRLVVDVDDATVTKR